MASFKLGAIFTDVAGSLAGTTFRRTPRGIIGYNKQGTQIKSAFATASVKNALGNVFARWNNLSESEVNFWNEKALLYPQLNKFGDLVYLTGRQFFTKLNTQLVPVNAESSISGFSDVLPDALVTNVTISKTDEKAFVYFDKEISSDYCMVRVKPTRPKSGSVKPHAHFRNTSVQALVSNTKLEFYSDFLAQYPFTEVGNHFIVHFIFMNKTGFQSSVQGFNVTIE